MAHPPYYWTWLLMSPLIEHDYWWLLHRTQLLMAHPLSYWTWLLMYHQRWVMGHPACYRIWRLIDPPIEHNYWWPTQHPIVHDYWRLPPTLLTWQLIHPANSCPSEVVLLARVGSWVWALLVSVHYHKESCLFVNLGWWLIIHQSNRIL